MGGANRMRGGRGAAVGRLGAVGRAVVFADKGVVTVRERQARVEALQERLVLHVAVT
jgi:hypothetical protein